MRWSFHILRGTFRVFDVISGYVRLQGGPLLDLLVLNGVNGLINGFAWGHNPYVPS